MLISKKHIPHAVIIAEVVLNVLMRQFSKPVFVYGNIACLITLSSVLLYFNKGTDFILSILVFGIMFSLLPDKMLFYPPEFQLNDAIVIGLFALSAAFAAYKKRPAPRFTIHTLLLLLAIPIKLYSQNSLEEVNGLSVYYIGNSLTHFLLGLSIVIRLVPTGIIAPALLFAGTLNDLIDNTVLEPYSFPLNERIVFGWVLLMCGWWLLYKYAARTVATRKWLVFGIVTLHFLCLLVLKVVGLHIF